MLFAMTLDKFLSGTRRRPLCVPQSLHRLNPHLSVLADVKKLAVRLASSVQVTREDQVETGVGGRSLMLSFFKNGQT